MKAQNLRSCLADLGRTPAMNDTLSSVYSRRELLKTTGRLAAASALAVWRCPRFMPRAAI